MTSAPARVSVTPEPGTPEALNWGLLAAILATHKHEISQLRRPSDIDRLLRKEDELLVLERSGYRRFRSWLHALSDDELRDIAAFVAGSTSPLEELLNTLANRFFPEETAKGRGAIFTPNWLADRLVGTAINNWRRLNVGREPSVAADLSCGPGVFLTELASELPKTKIVGIDNCAEYIALARLLTRRFRNVETYCADTLLTLRAFGQLTLEAAASPVPSAGYDILVGNPPYVRCQLLKSEYSRTLRELYPEFSAGNFDLATLFLAHTLEALAPGGVAALVISSKFMTSRYGAEICRRIGHQARLLEIVDFGDGQVFDGRTTYTCTLTFAKLPPIGTCKVLRFPPGLRWFDSGSHMSKADVAEVPCERFQAAPWDLSSGVHDDVLQLMRRRDCPRLLELFPNVSQGIRTGANQFFVVPNSLASTLEQEIVLPFLSGENIRRCRILAPDHSLIWPYCYTDAGAVVVVRENELDRSYPRAASYFRELREPLSSRTLEPGTPWYAYCRSQNLDLAQRPKLIARELMPRSEFVADEDGRYALCSGYALLPPARMPRSELRMWAAVLSTPTMEFQLRSSCTQLHSGWFRVLKQHLKRIHLPPFSDRDQSVAQGIADRLHENPDDEELWSELDDIVSRTFGLTPTQKSQVHSYVEQHHVVSIPTSLFDNDELPEPENPPSVLNNSVASLLSHEQREKYLPVELPEYYRLHSERENLRQAVTFADNKTTPIHRWYSFTQGFSPELVAGLLAEIGVSTRSRVYDPFVGSGTTLLACKEAGVPSFGAEISPLMCWVTRLKTSTWNSAGLREAIEVITDGAPASRCTVPPVFSDYFRQAYAPKILGQIFGWRDWIIKNFDDPIQDFVMLGLASILENVSQLRKHGSHYRFLNKTTSVGLAKLNIPVISSDADIKPLLVAQLCAMVSDVESVQFPNPAVPAEVFQLDSRHANPQRTANVVITSPPYLNRNMYFAQQKAELVLLNLVNTYEDYRALVRQTFRSHVEGKLSPVAKSDIPEVQAIVDRIQLSENNNAKIPHMICGYFEDLRNTLATLRGALAKAATLAFVVGNCRWGGVVVPVDHLLAMLAERLGYRTERIIVTRLKGNSPQQMRTYGKIPQRESIVLLKWAGENSKGPVIL